MITGPSRQFYTNGSHSPNLGLTWILLVGSFSMILSGLIVGWIGLALVSNQYGNTDIYGLPVVGLGGMILVTGLGSLFLKYRHAIIVGIAAAPMSIFLLFVLYWAWVVVGAIASR